MSDVKRYRFKGAAGEYVYAGDFDDAMRSFLKAAELCLDAERREAALQQRLNTADQRIDEMTARHQGEQVALMPVERSYDVRAKQILAFNTCKQGGGDLDDALGAAYNAALRYTPHPGEQPAPGSVVRPVDPERERLIEIIERYPNSDPLEYDAAVRKLQQ